MADLIQKPMNPDETREKLKALAWWLDSSIRLPGGFRIGADAIVGLVPFLGDVLGLLLSGYIVLQAARLRAPWSVLAHDPAQRSGPLRAHVDLKGRVGQPEPERHPLAAARPLGGDPGGGGALVADQQR